MSNTRLHLFQAYGVELEYMIVDRDTLRVKPITDELFKKIVNEYTSDVVQGKVTWCNELVLHVVELKCTVPEHDLVMMGREFQANVQRINAELASFNAILMPTAAHPFMNPDHETFIWPHENQEIYHLYNKIFNCRGHGWSNLQSTHLNLPFYDDEEFARLHAAIRCILPILPALSASSPILGGKYTGFLDKRLDYYQHNQKIVPAVTGRVIPEKAFSKRQYGKLIYDRIANDIKVHDPEGILKPVWLNSRGAIARFDRGSIEIRILDIQECPAADMAIVTLIICVLKMLVEEQFATHHEQLEWEIEPLHQLFNQVIKSAELTEINLPSYTALFGVDHKPGLTVGGLWSEIYDQAVRLYPEELGPWERELKVILKEGTLATRILKYLDGVYTLDNIRLVYRELADCLMSNEMFGPCVKEKS